MFPIEHHEINRIIPSTTYYYIKSLGKLISYYLQQFPVSLGVLLIHKNKWKGQSTKGGKVLKNDKLQVLAAICFRFHWSGKILSGC